MGDPNKDLESGGGDSARRLYPNLDELGSSPGTMNMSQLTSLLRPIPPNDSPPTWINPPREVTTPGASTFGFGGSIVTPPPPPGNDSPPTGVTSSPAINSSQAPQPYIYSNGFRFGFGGNTVTPEPTPVTPSTGRITITSNPHPQMTYLPRAPAEHGSGDRSPFTSQPETFGGNSPLPAALRLHQARLQAGLIGKRSHGSKISPGVPHPHRSASKKGYTSSCNAIAEDLPEDPAIPASKLFRNKTHRIHRPLGTSHPYRATYGGKEPNLVGGNKRFVDNDVILQSITGMPKYSNKSLEELRWEDYQLIRKKRPEHYTFGSSSALPFGGTPLTVETVPFIPCKDIITRSYPTLSADRDRSELKKHMKWTLPSSSYPRPRNDLYNRTVLSDDPYGYKPDSVSAGDDRLRSELKKGIQKLEKITSQLPRTIPHPPPAQPMITRVTLHFPRRLTLSFIALNILVFLIVLVIGAVFWSQRTHQ